MAYQYVTVSEQDLGKGIDARSTQNKIMEGYAEDLLNVDTNSNGFLSKRRGYQGYYGYLPLRVISVEHSGTDITFTFDSSIDVSNIANTPIVVQGRLSASQSGDWSNTDNAEYYAEFTTSAVKPITAAGSTLTVPESDHNNDTPWLFVDWTARTSGTTNTDNTHLWADSITIDPSDPYDVDYNYDVAANTNVSTLIADKQAASGEVYTSTTTVAPTTQTFTFTDSDVTVGTDSVNETGHGLVTGNIITLSTTGTVPAGLAVATEYYVIRTDNDNFKLASSAAAAAAGTAVDITAAAGGGTHTLTAHSQSILIPATTHALNNFIIQSQVFYDNGTAREKFAPEFVKLDAVTGFVEINVVNTVSSTSVYTILNTAPVDNIEGTTVAAGAAGSITFTPDTPFTFVTVYQSVANTLEEVLPDSIVYDSTSEVTTVNLTNSSAVAVAYTVFYENVSLSSTALTVTDNSTTSATYTDATPQLTLWGIPQSEITNGTGTSAGHVTHIDTYKSDLEERLVAGLGGNLYGAYARSEIAASYLVPSTEINIQNRVATEAALSPLFAADGSGAARTRGIITDASISDNRAIVTTVTYVDSTTADYTLSFTNKTGTISTAINTNDKFEVSGMAHAVWNGTFTFVSVVSEDATSAVIRLTTTTATLEDYNETGAQGAIGCFTDQITLTDATAFAAGDTIITEALGALTPTVLSTSSTTMYVSGISSVVVIPAGTVIYGSRTSAVLPVASTANIVRGDMLSITGYTRQPRVLSIDTSASTVTVDESITTTDGTTASQISVVGRWIPIEAPTPTDDLPPSTILRHFDAANYDAQATMRSVMVADNLYLTNNSDEIYKFDGTNLYQAGVFRWQPQLFVQLDTETTSITRSGPTAAVSAVGGNKFTVTLGTEQQFSVGDRIVHSQDNATYIVQSTSADSSNGFIFTTATITGSGSGTVGFVNRYTYYFRLSAVDANQNIIASAATGASEFIVDLTEAGQIHMRLVGFPAWGNYDYDRLEIEVYRTQADTAAPFYRVRTADMDFNAAGGYIDVVDSTNDADLQDLDPVNTALVGAEIGTGWSQPLRGKYITSADNRLILANVRDYPEIDIVLRKSSTATAITAANLNQKSFLFRRDNTDTGTSTNMVDRAVYEFVISGAAALDGSVAPFTFSTGDVTHATDTITVTAHGLLTGALVRLTTAGSLPAGLTVGTNYFIIRVDANNFKFATTIDNAVAGTAIDITDAGTGTSTVTEYTGIVVSSGVATFNVASHGLAVGNWIYVYHAATATDNTLALCGWYQVDATTTNTFTIGFTEHGLADGTALALSGHSYVTATTKTNIPVWLGTDGNYNQVGGNTINEFTAILRLANAINASMRMTDIGLSGQTTFVPWLIAGAGSEYGVGRLVVRQPRAASTTPEVKLPAAITTGAFFVNNILRAAEAEVSASTRVFPSRVILSYPNYPEIFDNPFGPEGAGVSAVDVNSADGQEITGIIPFFGSAVFGASQVEGVLVVFKTNSVYLLDPVSRRYTKLQSRGLGCTAPYSIASTREGIIFANESGIYRLNRDQSISYVGKYLERIWQDVVNQGQLATMTGHHYGTGRQYKLSVPVDSATTNSLVLVYDHEREGRDMEFGAWSKYDNHAATGWANLGNDAFFATTDGQVYSVRRANDSTDYRDDAAAISATITLRATDFGASGIRKAVASVNSHFQLRRSNMTGTALAAAADLGTTFEPAGTFVMDNLGTLKTESALSSLPRRRVQHLQLRYTNAVKDEDLVLAGVDYSVAGLTTAGLPQQNE